MKENSVCLETHFVLSDASFHRGGRMGVGAGGSGWGEGGHYTLNIVKIEKKIVEEMKDIYKILC